jgi:hypothetical protein
MDGDPVGTGLGANIRDYGGFVSDEYRDWMSGQEIGREEPREGRHVAELMVVLERVHVSEISCIVSHSVKLDAGVELEVENCRRFGKRLVKFGFDVVAIVGKTAVPV